jgi:adenosyl cobinamide kinase/adenosyl cobinamide phosphate guanylyltransferase/NaMN:DMB phosphoribosyltransferase
MATPHGPRTLVLGGIRSGKSDLAERLAAAVPDERVRYLATARDDGTDPEWTARISAHRDRRPADWATVEVGADPRALIGALSAVEPGQSVLVDDLGTWLAGALEEGGADALIAELAAAIAACPARTVLVSPEVGLSVVPATALGRAFADALGTLNRAVADECDGVVLVVAGQPMWVKGGASVSVTAVQPTAIPPEPSESTGAPAIIEPGLSLPMPDEGATEKTRQRLDSLDLGIGAPAGVALGALSDAVAFVAGAQGNPFPRPLLALRVLLLKADHAGGLAAGPAPDPRQATPLRHLAGAAGAALVTLELAAAGPIETGDAASADAINAAMRSGWAEAERAADEGIELIVLAAGGAGAASAATAVVAAVTGAEPTSLLARVATPDGRYDDEAWMARCLAVRDGLRRVKGRNGDPRQVLAALGGTDVAAATGLLLGAASRRTPVMIDGPVGVAAGLLARDFAFTSRQWLLLADHGEHPTVRLGADVLGLRPFVSLRLDLGEGGTSLATLPLLQTALTLASKGSAAPRTAPEAGDSDAG